MARKTKIEDDSSEDEFPALSTLLQKKMTTGGQNREASQSANATKPALTRMPSTSIRRRKLGQLTGRTLLQTWTGNDNAASSRIPDEGCMKEAEEPQGPRVKLRARKPQLPQPTVTVTPREEEDDDDGFVSAKEEITFVEEATVHEDDDDISEFQETDGSEFQDEDDHSDTEIFFDSLPTKNLARARSLPRERKATPPVEEISGSGTNTLFGDEPERKQKPRKDEVSKGRSQVPDHDETVPSRPKKTESARTTNKRVLEEDLTNTFSRLNLDNPDNAQQDANPQAKTKSRAQTPPLTPPKPRKEGLVSPKKFTRIPTTPHHPTSDMFWSQEFVDDWNDQHSPKKVLFPDAGKSPRNASSPKKPAAKTAAVREAKKAFEKDKHATAEAFLQELDRVITNGELFRLAATTGGIKLNWTNKLNTTAGRANWKRETVRTRGADGTTVSVTHRHHASIELAEKVIDDTDRLLNVVAHEFCHLANFMINGVTNNPHGKEFKAWAARCSRVFGDRGIQVTTKHSYDIDFKYVWECTECASAFKRHSKSINPARHRCGTCKGPLVQTKPVPRATAGKTSEYQKFMKEQMRVLKEENPKSPQKEIMKLVADRWSREAKTQGKTAAKGQAKLDDVVNGLGDLNLGK